MSTLKVYWAGILLFRIGGVADRFDLKEKLQELKQDLKDGKLQHISCGTTITLTELCIDEINSSGEFVGMHNIKV